jgi:hypothetical protein
MAYLNGPQIVRDGLVLYLDAGNRRSYPGSGTSWTDLTGNGNTGTLTNGPTFDSGNGGNIVFDGVNDFANFSNRVLTNAVTAISCFMWAYPTSGGILLSVLGQATINSGYHHSAIEVGSSGELRMALWAGNLTNRVNSQLSFNTWNNVGFTYAGTTLTGYLNGSSVGTTTFTWTKPSANIHFGIMALSNTNMGTGAYGHGNVSSFLTYNRALTATEVLQNFNATRSRFGV